MGKSAKNVHTSDSSQSWVSVKPSPKGEGACKILKQAKHHYQDQFIILDGCSTKLGWDWIFWSGVMCVNDMILRLGLENAHLVNDLAQDDCIETGLTWLFPIFCCALFRFKHPSKMGPVCSLHFSSTNLQNPSIHPQMSSPWKLLNQK